MRLSIKHRLFKSLLLAGAILLIAPTYAQGLPNGAQCSSNGECQSKTCYPGPGDGTAQYCMAQDKNCALPGSDGVMYGYQYSDLVCLDPGGGGRARIAEPKSQSCPRGSSMGAFGMCYPNIGGAIGGSFEHIKAEARAQLAGNPLALWLIGSRDTAIRTAKPIPASVRSRLRGIVSEPVLAVAMYKIGDTGLLNAAPIVQRFSKQTAAVTLIDVVVFRNQAGADDVALWAHELAHVDQFMRWGVRDFGIRYTRDYGAVEREAETWRERFVSGSTQRAPAPTPHSGVANGQACTSNSQCQSASCYPGPGDGSLQYCTAREKHCALPGTDGVMYGFKYNGMVCRNPGDGSRARITN